jgi:hypothetical protein
VFSSLFVVVFICVMVDPLGGTRTSTNFYPQYFCRRAGNYSTRPESDLLPSLLEPDRACAFGGVARHGME